MRIASSAYCYVRGPGGEGLDWSLKNRENRQWLRIHGVDVSEISGQQEQNMQQAAAQQAQSQQSLYIGALANSVYMIPSVDLRNVYLSPYRRSSDFDDALEQLNKEFPGPLPGVYELSPDPWWLPILKWLVKLL